MRGVVPFKSHFCFSFPNHLLDHHPHLHRPDHLHRKKEARRMAKDVARLNPIVLWGGGGGHRPQMGERGGEGGGKRGGCLPPSFKSWGGVLWSRALFRPASGPCHRRCRCSPPPIPSRAFPHRGFESVGGSVGGAVQTLKEIVLLPLLYPELLAGMGTSPPG